MILSATHIEDALSLPHRVICKEFPKGGPITIEQGGNNRIFNSVKLKCQDDKVLFGGKATKKIDGKYYL